MKLKMEMLKHRRHFLFLLSGTKDEIKDAETKVEANKMQIHVDITDVYDNEDGTHTLEIICHRQDTRKARYYLKEQFIKQE